MVLRKIVPGARPQLSDVSLGFPDCWCATSPIKASEKDGLAIARRWEYREEFVFLLYELAPGFLRKVHERIYPAFISAFEAITNSPVGEQLLKDQIPPLIVIDDKLPTGIRSVPISGKTARISWLDLQEPVQELSQLALAVESVVAPHCLWTEWFVDFVLSLMAARHSDLLVDYREPELRSPRISSLGRSIRPADVVTWDTLNFDFQYEFSRVSGMPFKALQKALIEQVLADLDDIREEHRRIREAGRKLKLTEKKRRLHLSWLIQHIFPEDGGNYLGFTEITERTFQGEVSTVEKGIKAAAKELGITLPGRGRGGNRRSKRK